MSEHELVKVLVHSDGKIKQWSPTVRLTANIEGKDFSLMTHNNNATIDCERQALIWPDVCG